MNLIFFHPATDVAIWRQGLTQRLPHAQVRVWRPGDDGPADYALVWHPPQDMLAGRNDLKGVFVLGAGVDAIIAQQNRSSNPLASHVPIIRLEDAGMAEQMVEYTLAALLRYYRRLDDYGEAQRQKTWRELPIPDKKAFVVGIAGAGVLGRQVALAARAMGFPVRCWSHSAKNLAGVTSFAGPAQFCDFLSGLQVLVNVLPGTAATAGILNAALFARLNNGAYIINIARGTHLVEDDLLAAMKQGLIAAATLDVCGQEPLPWDHPFWTTPGISLTPHIAADTVAPLAMESIADNILRIENGQTPSGVVSREKGY